MAGSNPPREVLDMLPPFIIEQIRKREERQRVQERVLELPLDNFIEHRVPSAHQEEAPQRGVIIVEL